MTEQVPVSTHWDNALAAPAPGPIAGLFAPPSSPVTAKAAILWWEKRRLTYNVIMFATAAIALVVFFIAIGASGQLRPGEDAVEPLGLVAGAIIYPIAINVCYTFGWALEVMVRAFAPDRWPRFGPVLFGLGLSFSVVLVSSPAIFWIVVLLGQALHIR